MELMFAAVGPVDGLFRQRTVGWALAWKPFLVLVAATLVGCGGAGLAPVSGTVTMDGSPLEGATVTFHPQPGVKSNGGSGTSDAAGKFTVLTPQGKRGIIPGDYSITVSRRKLSEKAQKMIDDAKASGITPMVSDREMAETLPKPYSKPETSPLRVSIAAGGGDVPVEIESSPASAKPGK